MHPDGGPGSFDDLFDDVIRGCRATFDEKFREYGPSWRYLRARSLRDRIFAKAARIRRLESLGGVGKVDEPIDEEFVGIVNYSVIFIDRLQHDGATEPTLSSELPERWSDAESALGSYDAVVRQAKELVVAKNHDYDGAWRSFGLETFTDEVLNRVLRIQQLLSEEPWDMSALEGQLLDTVNYGVLRLMRQVP